MKGKKLLVYMLIALYSLAMIGIPGFSPVGELVATVSTDESSYVLRETVEVHGGVIFQGLPVDRGLIGTQVDDPLNNPMVARTIPTGTGNSENWGVEIVSFYLSDAGGHPQSKVERGESTYFFVTVKNNKFTSQNVLITINIYDSTLIPLNLRSVALTLNPEGSAAPLLSTQISEWASVGNAPAYANVYSGWPENGGYPLCPEKMTNFTIIESIYEEPPDNPIPDQPVQNGTYTTSFQLSPEPIPGTYTVNVCAWYSGYYSEAATTTFQVEDVAAPPIASFVVKPPMASPNYTITFDASSSSPEGYNDTIISYIWDFDDGQNSTSKITTHEYTNFGNYTVTLNVTDSEGFWNTTSKSVSIAEIHDIALTSIQCLDEIYSDWIVTITIGVKNKGTYAETFNVTAYYNSSIIETKTITNLGPQIQTDVDIQWNTIGLPLYVHYTISAEADILPNETATADNNITYGTTTTKGLGDFDGDTDVDIFDVVRITALYGVTSGDPDWNIQADLEPDGKIDIYDVVIVASRYGTQY